MRSVPDNIETLIVRQLDGTIGEDEELSLNRELIRNPEARQMRDEYRRIDAMASASLTGLLTGAPTLDVESLPTRGEARRPRALPTRWLVPGAIAAGLLAWTLAREPFVRPTHERPGVAEVFPSVGRPIVPPLGPTDYSGDLRQNAGFASQTLARPSVKRGTGREVIGVVGDDGNLYWIEVDRTRTVRRPGGLRF